MSYSPTWSLKLDEVLDDTSPQLGGNLDVNGSNIVNTSGTDVVFTEDVKIDTAQPTYFWRESDASADNRVWSVYAISEELFIQARNDAGAGGGNLFKFTRSGNQLNTFEARAGGSSWYLIDSTEKAVTMTSTTAPGDTTDKLYNVSGTLTWNGMALAGAGGLNNIVEDTTPQLGGDLDVNGNDIITADTIAPATAPDDLNILAGRSGDQTGSDNGANGGDIRMTAGLAGNVVNGTGGNGGWIYLTAGNAGVETGSGSAGEGGNIRLTAGNAGAAQFKNGGRVQIYAGEGNGAGIVEIRGGAAVGPANNGGGAVTITAGNGYNFGGGGVVELIVGGGGASDPDDIGDVRINGPSSSTVAPALKFLEGGSGFNYVGFKAPDALGGDQDYTWPTALPGGNYVLQSTTLGVMSWVDPSTFGGGISNVVEDTTPQLGGDLDVNGNDIISASGDIRVLAAVDTRFRNTTDNSDVLHLYHTAGSEQVEINGIVDQEGGTVLFRGATTIEAQLTVDNSTFPAFQAIREESQTTGVLASARLQARSTGDMTDGYGPVFYFSIEDTAATVNNIAQFGCVRNGADNTGKLVFSPANAGSFEEQLGIDQGGLILKENTAPTSDTSGFGRLYVDSSDSNLKFRDDGGTVTDLTAGGGGISAIVEDTSPQLGADLDANAFDILFDSSTGIRDENGNEQLIFTTTVSAANYLNITNAASGGRPKIESAGFDGNIDLELGAKGTGNVRMASGTKLDMRGQDITSTLGTGYITMRGGTNGTGGNAAILGGPGTTGNGGNADLQGGDTSFASGQGGWCNVLAGDSTNNFIGGSVSIQPGYGGLGDGTVRFTSTANHSDSTRVEFHEQGGGGNYVALRAPASLSANRTWRLPEDSAATAAGKFLTTDSSGNWSFDSPIAPGENLIINGAMEIFQRSNTGPFTNVNNNVYTLDRWVYGRSGVARHTITQQTTGGPSSDYPYWIQLQVTNPDPSLSASEHVYLEQRIEGWNYRQMRGKTVEIGFWVRDSYTGLHAVSIRSGNGLSSFVRTYSITTANTWEYHTVEIPMAETYGTWNLTNGSGCYLDFGLAAGTSFQGTPNVWLNSAAWATSSTVNSVAANGAIFGLTGVSLRVIGSGGGENPRRLYHNELMLAGRYFLNMPRMDGATLAGHTIATGHVRTTTSAELTLHMPVPMRTTPSLTDDNLEIQSGGINRNVNSVTLATGADGTSRRVTANWSSSVTTQYACILISQDTTGYLYLDAEL